VTPAVCWGPLVKRLSFLASLFSLYPRRPQKVPRPGESCGAPGAGLDAQQDAAEIKLRAERRLGEMLAETVVPRGNHGDILGAQRSLPEGVDKKESLRFQKVASLPDAAFEQHIAEMEEPLAPGTQRGYTARGQPDTRAIITRRMVMKTLACLLVALAIADSTILPAFSQTPPPSSPFSQPPPPMPPPPPTTTGTEPFSPPPTTSGVPSPGGSGIAPPAVAPEPASIISALLGVGMTSLVAWHRRRNVACGPVDAGVSR
jgi:hypothetical protein